MEERFHIVLVEPRIPANTGNLIRLSANLGVSLHLIHPLGFDLEDAKLRRAGLDYSDLSDLHEHKSFDEYVCRFPDRHLVFFTSQGTTLYSELLYTDNDSLIFGSEDTGIPGGLLDRYVANTFSYLPMMPKNRSINLSNAVAIAAYEAWRQLGFYGAESRPERPYFS